MSAQMASNAENSSIDDVIMIFGNLVGFAIKIDV